MVIAKEHVVEIVIAQVAVLAAAVPVVQVAGQ